MGTARGPPPGGDGLIRQQRPGPRTRSTPRASQQGTEHWELSPTPSAGRAGGVSGAPTRAKAPAPRQPRESHSSGHESPLPRESHSSGHEFPPSRGTPRLAARGGAPEAGRAGRDRQDSPWRSRSRCPRVLGHRSWSVPARACPGAGGDGGKHRPERWGRAGGGGGGGSCPAPARHRGAELPGGTGREGPGWRDGGRDRDGGMKGGCAQGKDEGMEGVVRSEAGMDGWRDGEERAEPLPLPREPLSPRTRVGATPGPAKRRPRSPRPAGTGAPKPRPVPVASAGPGGEIPAPDPG